MSLYQDQILDHYRNPRNFGSLNSATHHSDAKNPTCGDALHMDVRIRRNQIDDIHFTGSGCAISQASASLLTEHVKGKRIATALSLTPDEALTLLGVTLSPGRLKCGLLALETLKKALLPSSPGSLSERVDQNTKN